MDWSFESPSIGSFYKDADSLNLGHQVRSFPFWFQFGGKVCFDHASPNKDMITNVDLLILDTLVIVLLLAFLCFDYVIPGFLPEFFSFLEGIWSLCDWFLGIHQLVW